MCGSRVIHLAAVAVALALLGVAPQAAAQTLNDLDGDGILNGDDNCPFTVNLSQTDSDFDGIGDACDVFDNRDFDGDGDQNGNDNCPFSANASQLDTDGDGIGNACDLLNDLDIDSDGDLNAADNCPFTANSSQADVDGDGVGDACDPFDDRDLDSDGVLNISDNCPFAPNPSQTDTDGDGHGDPCDFGTTAVPNVVHDGEWVAGAAPNPSAERFRIRFTLPTEARGSLAIYDVAGRMVRLLLNGTMPAGPQTVEWDGRTDSGAEALSGMYYCRLQAAEGRFDRTLVKMR